MVRKTKKEEPLFIKWLKRIFSAQTISIIIGLGGCVGAYYAYRDYKEHQPAQVSMYIVQDNFLEIRDGYRPDKDLSFLYYLRYPINNKIIGWEDDHGPLLFRNETNKSIKDFRAEVDVFYPSIINLDFYDICKDYEIIKCDTISALDRKILHLRYRYDVLNGHTNLPMPISKMTINVDHNLYNQDISFDYSITYDGIKEPIHCEIIQHINYDSCASEEGHYPIMILEDFLDKYYHTYQITSNSRDKIIAVIERSWWANDVILPPKNYMDESTFERAKKKVLENGIDYSTVYKIKE